MSATRLTAIVPAGVEPAANPYDVIVVNPDGTVGVLTMPDAALYRSTTLPPPVIDSVTPGAVPNSQPPPVTLTGRNFRSPTVTFNCITDVLLGTRMQLSATVSSSTATSITINNPPVGSLPAPSLCTLRVTNGDDQSFYDFDALAISNSSGNLSASRMTNKLPAPRRAASVAASFATSAARFIYAIGGDSGSAVGATSTVFTARADETGAGTWFTQRYALNANRTLGGVAALGRYLYVVGGNDGTGPVATVERARVLDPLEAPTITDVDIVPGMGMGLGGGVWVYRVAAVMDATDPDNPGGETLPSDVFTLQLPDLAQKLQVKLAWTQVTGAVGYVVYRTPVAGKIAGEEEQLATVSGGATLTYTDTGGATDSGQPKPLVQGSTGKWRQLPALGSARESAGVVFGVDPVDASKHYLYALLGKSTNSANSALGSYEFLTVTVGSNGAQSFGSAWTAGSKSGAALGTTARYQLMAYSASPANSSFVQAGKNYIYVGGGTSQGTMTVQSLDVATVTSTGDLGTFAAASSATIKTFGSGSVAAANYLYTFGDDNPSTAVRAGQIAGSNQAPSIVNFQNNGASLTTARYLPGVDLSGALIYVVGGASAATKNNAVDTVETFIW